MLRFAPRASSVRTASLIVAALALGACGDDNDVEPQSDPADVIELPGAEIFPEGVAITADGTLFTGSITTGQIFIAHAGEAQAAPFADVGGGALGLLVDEARDLLWACDSNPLQGTPPAVVGLDMTGAEVARHAFPGDAGLCNDLALSPQGDLYATDSFGHRIVRIAADDILSGGSAQAWVSDEAFEVPEGNFGLNGITFDGDTLYAVTYATGALLAIDVSADGVAGPVRTVALERPLAGADGLKREAGGALLVVEGGSGALSRLVLDGDTATIEPVLSGLDSPATFALRGGRVWMPVSQLDHLFGFDPAPADATFVVRAHDLGE